MADLTELFSISHTLVHIPIGNNGYALSWIEAIGSVAGLLCIWLASVEKNINYLFGVINVTLFAIIFYQIQLYASLLLQVFFFVANIYGWIAWSQMSSGEQKLQIRWMSRAKALISLVTTLVAIGLLTIYIDTVFGFLAQIAYQVLQLLGLSLAPLDLAPDAYPFWDASATVLSVVAMILMTRKYAETWYLWVIINLISIMLFMRQGVYVMAFEYVVLLAIALNGCRVWTRRAKPLHASN